MSTSVRRATVWTRLKPLITIVGCTGTGKSQLAVDLARQFNGEIINADALQIYRGLPVATNKLKQEDMNGIPHHLFDCIGIYDSPWYSAKFVKEAERVIDDIRERGKLPILVGGTHYYIHSLLSGANFITTDTVEADTDLDTRWPILQGSADAMLDELRRLDPVAASWWHPKERQKIRRSLEICLQSGGKVSQIYERQRKSNRVNGQSSLQHDALCLYLHADRAILNARLDARVDQMIEAGLIDEAWSMWKLKKAATTRDRNIDISKGIWIAIGFKEFEPYFKAMENEDVSPQRLVIARAEANSRTKTSTRQYAKRQSNYVRNKLIPLFNDCNCEGLFRSLDASSTDQWNDLIVEPARKLTKHYLESPELMTVDNPHPQEVEILPRSAPQIKKTNCCKHCDVTTTTEKSWESHLGSKRHKMAMKRQPYNRQSMQDSDHSDK